MNAKDYINKKLNEVVISQPEIDFFTTGGCIDFAYAYQDIFGEDNELIAIWGNYDPEDEDAIPELIHVFCINSNGQKGVGVDVKGWQDYKKLVDSYSEYFIDDAHITERTDKKEIKNAIDSSGGDLEISQDGYNKATLLIKNNIEFYKPR